MADYSLDQKFLTGFSRTK